MKSKKNPKIKTKNSKGINNGFLVPIYNINEKFFPPGQEPKQVYLTVITENEVKGPHLHYIRNGCFTCIKGNIRIVIKQVEGYEEYMSGEDYDYQSVIIPKGTPAALQNIGSNDAYVLNMPSPAWNSEMNDEYTADFSDFDFKKISI